MAQSSCSFIISTGQVQEDEVDDSKILPYCSIERKKKSIGEMEQEFLQALQVLKQIHWNLFLL